MVLHGSLRVLPGRVVALLKPDGTAWQKGIAALPIPVLTLLLAYLSLSGILEKTQGVAAAPLDDAYIHLQFARSFANGTPLVYAPETAAVAGATSLLWPALLSVPYALGLQGHAALWSAWLFGFTALGLLAHEVRRSADKLCSPLMALGAAGLVLAFGANSWFAASGMEVVPLAFLLLRSARRSAEWWEAASRPGQRAPARTELLAIAWLLPLMRPEGALGTLIIAAVLISKPRGASRAFGALALLGIAVPPLVNWVFTSDFASTTARSKWLLLSPYATPSTLISAFTEYARLLVGTLLDGRVWSALFLPRGSGAVFLLSVIALPVLGVRRGLTARAIVLTIVALGILIPATYDCPLCNRLRYLWPFVPAWMVGTAALAELAGDAVSVLRAELRPLSLVFLGTCIGALAGYLPFANDDLAMSARAIFDQQVSLGLWARDSLPQRARIGVNDTGAIAYFSGKSTFDVVGLTTRGEARYWAAGAGSRLEHYERLGGERLPTHYIVYPEWFAIDDLLGRELTERFVPGATILGGERMIAAEADYSKLGSGEAPDPTLAAGRQLVDRVDVADLESEREHGFELHGAEQRSSIAVSFGDRLDGARSQRTRDTFLMDVRPRGALVVRIASEAATNLEIVIGALKIDLPVPASPWHEARLDLGDAVEPGRQRVMVQSRAGTFTSLHYFSLAQAR